MSKHTLIISFPALHGSQNHHRVLNFAEDIYYHFQHNRRAIIEDIDTPENEIRLFVPKSRFLGEVIEIVNDELKKSFLADDAIVAKKEGIHPSK